MSRIYFLSSNPYKIEEVKSILHSYGIEVLVVKEKIKEIQSKDMEEIVIDKALRAFKIIGRPLLVEQTGLLLKDLGGFPGGLTQLFWDALGADKFCHYFSEAGKASALAQSFFAYCNGKKIVTRDGKITGSIVEEPRGDRGFQWDCVFQPDGYNQTFAQMGDFKNSLSMRKIALEALKFSLEEGT